MGTFASKKQKNSSVNSAWIPSNQYSSKWEKEPALLVTSDNCISTSITYIHNDKNESESESSNDNNQNKIRFVAVGSSNLNNIGSTENDGDFTHIIGATVAVKLLKGNTKDAIILFNDDDTFISMDCPKCKRVHRSVFFKKDGKANCTGSTGHGDGPGQIIKIETFMMENIVLATFTMAVRWVPFIDSKYPDRESKSINYGHARIGFEIECRICGKQGKKYPYSYITYDNGTHYNREYIKCKHIHCIEYNSDPKQPWMRCREIVVNDKILYKLLQSTLSNVLSNPLIVIIVGYSSGYW
eukprot:4807_1